MVTIKVGIVGGAGYTAGELLRILVQHPAVQIVFVHSTSNAENSIDTVHSGLVGETNLKFTSELAFDSIDILFLCSAHGDSKIFLDNNKVPPSVKIIDLSADYRIKNQEHNFVYGLPELNSTAIEHATHVANPGCFATAIQIALLPLAVAGLLKDSIHVNAVTGSTGAGVKHSDTSHFSWRDNNMSVYKPFTHQHLSEVTQSIRQLQPDFKQNIRFIPLRGNFTRGIYLTAYTTCSLSEEYAKRLYANFFKDTAFTYVANVCPDMKQVINTNKGIVYVEKHNEILFIVATIDNLLKGASGQAVQNMNLMFGLPEKTGLMLKSIGF